jgi:hypothetical protein
MIGETKEKEVQKFLAEVTGEYVFFCRDGRLLRSMKDLSDAFSEMPDETYRYHWNKEKKDFSNWVKDVIGDAELAADLARATSPSLAAWEVATRMAYLARQLPQYCSP